MKLFILGVLVSFSALAGTHFNKTLIIVFENTDFNDAMKQPYFSSLARDGALANNYFALTHPSQPNYIALISGSTFGVTNDSDVDLNQRHIGDLLEASNMDWKVYSDGYPGNCFLGSRKGDYVRKHNPFMSFTDVQHSAERCNKTVSSSSFRQDFEAGKLPTFSLYVPDLKNDGHDTGVAFGDKWLQQNFGPYFSSSKMPKDLLVIITFDEGSRISNNRIYTLFWGAGVKKGIVTNKRYDHYSTLKTIEEEFNLGNLGQNDVSAESITDIWQ